MQLFNIAIFNASPLPLSTQMLQLHWVVGLSPPRSFFNYFLLNILHVTRFLRALSWSGRGGCIGLVWTYFIKYFIKGIWHKVSNLFRPLPIQNLTNSIFDCCPLPTLRYLGCFFKKICYMPACWMHVVARLPPLPPQDPFHLLGKKWSLWLL